MEGQSGLSELSYIMGVRFSGMSVKRGSTVQTSKLLIEKEACTPNLRTPTCFDCKNCCFSVNNYSVLLIGHRPNTEYIYNIRNHGNKKHLCR